MARVGFRLLNITRTSDTGDPPESVTVPVTETPPDRLKEARLISPAVKLAKSCGAVAAMVLPLVPSIGTTSTS